MADILPPGSNLPIMTTPHRFLDAKPTVVSINPHPFQTNVKPVFMTAGLTIAEIVACSGVDRAYLPFLSVWVDDYLVPRAQWARIRPREGRHVYVRAIPQGGGDNSGLRSLLMLVVVAAATAFAGPLAGMLLHGMGLAATGFGLALATAVVSTGITLLGFALVNALIPPPSPTSSQSQRQLLTGVNNQFSPYAFVPRHYGKKRVYPLQAARPYTEAQGDNRFLRVLLLVGYGPLKISQIKIGDTPIEHYSAIQYQVKEGWDANHGTMGLRALNDLDIQFTPSFSSFVTSSATATQNKGKWRFTATAGTPVVDMDLSATPFTGSDHPRVRVRFRKCSPAGATWRGALSWKTSGHGYSVSSYGCTIDDLSPDNDEWIVVEWYMPDAQNGAADWTASTITGLRLALFNNSGDVFEVDWVKIGALKADDTAQTLFTQVVNEENFNILLSDAGYSNGNPINSPGPWISRTTEEGCDEIGVDVTWPTGLAKFEDNGTTTEITVACEIQYRLAGTSTWYNVVWDGNDTADGTQINGQVVGQDNSRTATTRGGHWLVPNGMYEVQMRRLTPALSPDRSYAQDAQWTCLRSIKGQNPVNLKGCALIAIRMKATDQLNGIPDTINCIVESYVTQHYGQSYLWELSRSPAWSYMDVMRRRGADALIANNRIDLPSIRDWAKQAALTAPNANEEYWSFDGTFEGGSVINTLRAIASHGRANFAIRDGKYSVVNDIKKTIPEAHITPRNSFGYSGVRAFIDQPDALRVQYVNAANGYQPDEIIVYADGFDETNASKFEVLPMPNCTSATQAWRDARYFLAVGQLRPDTHQVSQDVEFLKCSQGSYVMLAHDVISIGLVTTRIVGLVTAGANTTGLLVDNEVQRDAGVSFGVRVRLSDGTSIVYKTVIVSTSDYSTQINLQGTIPTATGPQIGDLLTYGEYEIEMAPMIVKKIEPGSEMTAKLTLVDAQDGVWDADTGDIPAFQTYVSDQTPLEQQAPPLPVFTYASNESVVLRLADGTLQDRIGVTLGTQPSGKVAAESWGVQWRQTGKTSWTDGGAQKLTAKQIFLAPVQQGQPYDFRVHTISAYGIASDWVEVDGYVVVGKIAHPGSVTGFIADPRVDGVQLNWDANPEIDVSQYTIVQGANWDTATVVSNKHSGTSIFIGVTVSGSQTFQIRAVDVLGNMSDSPTKVVVSILPPDDVEKFTAYPQGDNVRFVWSLVSGTGVQYEIREGVDWPTGRLVTKVAGTTITVKWPTRNPGTTTFWIKAVSAAKLYSVDALFYTCDVEDPSHVNIILDDDLPTSSWAGSLNSFAVVGSGSGSYLQVQEAYDGALFGSADFYKNISLSAVYTARTWIDAKIAITAGSQPWTTARFSWSSAGKISWAGAIADESAASLTSYIALADATYVPPTFVEAWSLNGTTTGSAGTAKTSGTPVYKTLTWGQGIDTLQSQILWNSVSLTGPYTVLFDFRFTWNFGSYLLFLLGIPADPSTDDGGPSPQAYGDFGLFQLGSSTTGSLNSVNLRYDASLNQMVLTPTTGLPLAINVDIQPNDLLTFGIAQDVGYRRLFMYNARTGLTTYAVDNAGADIGPLGGMRAYNGSILRAPGVLGNIEIRSVAMSASIFTTAAKTRTPVGYRPFQELVPADYKFQNAILWMNVKVDDPSLVVSVVSGALYVDVPDIYQTGTKTVSSLGAATVTFPKPFTTVPNLTVTPIIGAVPMVPKVTNLTTTSFDVSLRDASASGTMVGGTASWTATGY